MNEFKNSCELNTRYLWGSKDVFITKWNNYKSVMEDMYDKHKFIKLSKELGDELIRCLHNLSNGNVCVDNYMNIINKQPFERFKEIEDLFSVSEIIDIVEYYGREEFFLEFIVILDLFKETYKSYEDIDLFSLSNWLKYIYLYKNINNDYNCFINFSKGVMSSENIGMIGFEYFMNKIDNIQDESLFNKVAPDAMNLLNKFGKRKKHMLGRMLNELVNNDSIKLENIKSFLGTIFEIYSQANEILIDDEELENYFNEICNKIKLMYLQNIELLYGKYKNTKDMEIETIINNIKRMNIVSIYNYDFFYKSYDIDVFRDEEAQMLYIYYKGRKMYFPKKYTNEKDVKHYYDFMMKEQDLDSPHRYETEGMEVEEHAIVIDAGVAEGNFALDVIDRVEKIYLIECDSGWIDALKYTFKDEDKVILIKKMLNNKNDDESTNIDSIMKDQKINYLKMDIEGSELDALDGARKTLMQSVDCKCNICSYHKSGDAEKITEKLNEYGFDTFPSKGYMFFYPDIQSCIDLEFRRGLIKGIKKKS